MGGFVKRPLEQDYASLTAYTRALEEYCDVLAQPAQEPLGWWDAKLGFFDEKHFDQLQPVYTTPPQRTWVELTDIEIVRCVVHARFEYDPPYVDKNGVKHLAVYEVQAGPTYKNISAALQEKNT